MARAVKKQGLRVQLEPLSYPVSDGPVLVVTDASTRSELDDLSQESLTLGKGDVDDAEEEEEEEEGFCLLVAKRPSNILVYLRDGSA